MTENPKTPTLLTDLERLIAPGVLGFYTHVEATEIFAVPEGQKSTVNVFTILVTEKREAASTEKSRHLNAKRIRIKSLKGWYFGIERYVRPISDLVATLRLFEREHILSLSGEGLGFGKIEGVVHQFVPADPRVPVPLNRVLKNNFWNGSHVFEWMDPEKQALQLLFDVPQRLQDLSQEIQRYIPIKLGALSDRVGNLIVQLPVTTIITHFIQPIDAPNFYVHAAWNDEAASRPLRASCALDFDGSLDDYMSCPIDGAVTTLPMRAARGEHRGIIWDEQHKVVLADTAQSAFIRYVPFNLRVADPEPRTLTLSREDGSTREIRVGLQAHSVKGSAGKPVGDDNGGWTRKRMYQDETAALAAARLFVHYKPKRGREDAEHEKALEDLRALIREHGEKGAWLWDPYLDAYGIFETLFHCPYPESELRAIADPAHPLTFIAAQRSLLSGVKSNWRGVRLEFRVRHGNAGWPFHDRFLIFPQVENGALAWSLGTSLRSVGRRHHILQRVDDGQRIADAFAELWNALKNSAHILWKKP